MNALDIITLEVDYNSEAYKQGVAAWNEHVKSGYKTRQRNPYTKEQREFYFWNRGWNNGM